MNYMIINLKKEDYLDDILMALTEAEISETIVLEGDTLSHKLTFSNPIFAGFRDSIGDKQRFGRIIMGICQNEKQIDFMLSELKKAGMNPLEDEIITISLLPITKVYKKED